MNNTKNLKRSIALGFVVALLILIFVGISSYKNLTELHEINEDVQAIHRLNGKLENVGYFFQSMNSNSWNYIVSNNKENLQTYHSSKEKLQAALKDLDIFIPDTEDNHMYVKDLSELVNKRIAINENSLSVYNRYGKDSSISYIINSNTAVNSNALREMIYNFKDREEVKLQQKREFESERTDYTKLIIILGSALALAFVITATLLIFRDINKRSRVEREVNNKEKLFRAVVSNFPDGVISIYDKDLRYIFSDGAALKESGYKSSDVEGNYVKDIVPESVFPMMEVFYKDALKGFKNSIEFKHNNHYYSTTFLPLKIEEKIEGGIVISQNISKRKNAEEELRQSESYYRAIAENFPNGSITLYDRDLTILKVDGNILKEFGFDKENFEGKKINEIRISNDIDMEYISERYAEVFENRSSVFEILFGGRYFLVTTVPIKNERGEISFGMAISQDITSVKDYEEKIIQSRNFYLTLFEEFPAMIWRSGIDGKLDYFNKTWLDFTGRTMEEETGEGWKENINPVDLKECMKIYEQAFEKREPFTVECRIKRHDGEYRWISNHGRPFYNLEGEFSGYIGSCYDITDNRLASERREKNRQLTELLQDIAVTANESDDINQLIKFTIDRICEYTGWPVGHLFWRIPEKNELTSSRIWSDNLPEDLGEFRAIAEERTFKENQGLVGKVLMYKKFIWMKDVTSDPEFVRVKEIKDLKLKSGFAIPILVKSEIVGVCEFYTKEYTEEDQGLIQVMNNVSAQLGRAIERRWAQDILKKSEAALERAQKIAHIGSWEWNVQDNSLKWSDELYRIYGLDPEKNEINFEKYVSLIHSDDINYVNKVIENAMKEKSAFKFEHRIKRPDGNVRIANCQGEVILDDDGNILLMAGTGQDITEMKLAEENLRHTNRKLQEAQNELIQTEKLAAIGRIASNMAHEIRNPLANISASSQLLISKYKDNDSLKSYLEIIMRNSETANRIIKELLDFASPREIKLKEGDISKVIRQVSQMIDPRCTQNNIKLVVDNRLNGSPQLLLNEKKLEEAFMNFLSNAIDSMPEGGKLTFTTKFDEYNDEVIVTIEDTGYGIPQENLDKVFEPFFTTKETGTGLGMGLSHQIIKSHNGKLNIASEVGEGTKIEIKFPITEQPSKSQKNEENLNS